MDHPYVPSVHGCCLQVEASGKRFVLDEEKIRVKVELLLRADLALHTQHLVVCNLKKSLKMLP